MEQPLERLPRPVRPDPARHGRLVRGRSPRPTRWMLPDSATDMQKELTASRQRTNETGINKISG